MLNLNNYCAVTKQTARQSYGTRDLCVAIVAVGVTLAIAWHVTRPEPVLPKPQSSEVLAKFCERKP